MIKIEGWFDVDEIKREHMIKSKDIVKHFINNNSKFSYLGLVIKQDDGLKYLSTAKIEHYRKESEFLFDISHDFKKSLAYLKCKKKVLLYEGSFDKSAHNIASIEEKIKDKEMITQRVQSLITITEKRITESDKMIAAEKERLIKIVENAKIKSKRHPNE